MKVVSEQSIRLFFPKKRRFFNLKKFRRINITIRCSEGVIFTSKSMIITIFPSNIALENLLPLAKQNTDSGVIPGREVPSLPVLFQGSN